MLVRQETTDWVEVPLTPADRQRTDGERETVLSRGNGHPVSTGASADAESRTEDGGPQCYQGHRSAPGSRFCETCGALLAAEPAAAAELPADLTTEYTSGSFSDFFREDAGEDGEDGGDAPIEPAAAPSAREPAAAVTGSGALAGSAAAIAGHLRRRRSLAVGLAIAAAAAAAITGELALNHGAKPQAQAPARPFGAAPAASASVAPTAAPAPSASVAPSPSPTPPPAVVPAQPAPAAARPPVPVGHHGFFPGRGPVHFVLPGPPFVPHGLAAQERQIVLRIVASLPGLGHGGLGGLPGGFHRP
jgi:hypothetical protein